MAQQHCYTCGDLFQSARSTAKYCSNACKMQWHRRGSDMYLTLNVIEHHLEKAVDLLAKNPAWGSDEVFGHIEYIRDTLSRLDSKQLQASQDADETHPLYRRAAGWKCFRCGQQPLSEPAPSEKCSFCGSRHWKPEKAK